MRALLLLVLASAMIVGCSSTSSPSPQYSDLSQRMDDVMKRTKGDSTQLTPEDRKVVAQAKALGMTTPPGY